MMYLLNYICLPFTFTSLTILRKTYLKHKNKIIKGAIINNKPRKDFRFQLLMCTTRYEFNNTFNILYYENKYTKHFYALNKNDID